MKHSLINVDSFDSLISVNSLNWVDSSLFNNSDIKKNDITYSPSSLRKLLYKEWCLNRLKSKEGE